jgi:hypothetical protein
VLAVLPEHLLKFASLSTWGREQGGNGASGASIEGPLITAVRRCSSKIYIEMWIVLVNRQQEAEKVHKVRRHRMTRGLLHVDRKSAVDNPMQCRTEHACVPQQPLPDDLNFVPLQLTGKSLDF